MRLTAGLLAVALLAAACSAAGSVDGEPTSGQETWRSATFRDVLTGEEFRIDDLRGNVVAIEAMAVWCATCWMQQRESQAALDELASSDVVYISLDVDPNERETDLAEYARRERFDWRFVVASPEVSRSLVATFGDQILSPPATPLVVLDPSGEVVAQQIGITGRASLVALFREHLP